MAKSIQGFTRNKAQGWAESCYFPIGQAACDNDNFEDYMNWYPPMGNVVGKAGKVSHLSVRIRGNSTNRPVRFYLTINNVATALSVTVPTSGTGIFQNDADIISVAPGDRLQLKMTPTYGGGFVFAFSRFSVVVLYKADDGNASFHNTEAIRTLVAPTYQSLAGGSKNGFATESHAQTKVGASCTIKNVRVHQSVAFPASDITIRSRINGAYGNILVTITQNTTGEAIDLVHTDELNEGDLFDWEISHAGAGPIMIFCDRETTGHSKNEIYSQGENTEFVLSNNQAMMWFVGFLLDMPFSHGGVRVLPEGGIEGGPKLKFVFEKLNVNIVAAYTDPGQSLVHFGIAKALDGDYGMLLDVVLSKNVTGWQSYDVNFSTPDGNGATEAWKTTTQLRARIWKTGNQIFMLDKLTWNGFVLTYQEAETTAATKPAAFALAIVIVKKTKDAAYRVIVAMPLLELTAAYRIAGTTVKSIASKFVLKIFPFKKKASPYSSKESPFNKLKK